MKHKLYTPQLSDDVIRALYREAQRRRQPMTIVADCLLRQSLSAIKSNPTSLRIGEASSPIPILVPRKASAAFA